MNEITTPKRRGRPPLPKTETKTNYVPLRLSDDDYKAFNKAAKKAKVTISEWIRQTLKASIESVGQERQ